MAVSYPPPYSLLTSTDDKDLDTLTLFHTSKELFVTDVKSMDTFSPENFHEMKCLLADCDRTIVQLTMTTMTDALVRFGKEAADMFLEIGIPELALKRGSDRFTNVPFYAALKFISHFSRFHPEWICHRIDEIQSFLAITFVGQEHNFIFCSFDIIDVICECDCELLLKENCTILMELLKLLVTEKLKLSVEGVPVKEDSIFGWRSFFAKNNAMEAAPMDKHVFLRCLKSLTVICDKLSKYKTEKIEDFFTNLSDQLAQNSIKVINPKGSLHLLNVIIRNHPKVAKHVCDSGIISTIETGLTFHDQDVRTECRELLLCIAPYELQIQAYELLIDGLRFDNRVETEFTSDQIMQKHLPPITAMIHSAKDPQASIVLIHIGAVSALLELATIRNADIQKAVLEAVVKIGMHSSIHANQLARQNALNKILKINLASQASELVHALANGFTHILLKTTYIPSVAEAFYVCRYESGRKAIQQHLSVLLNGKKCEEFQKLSEKLKTLDLKKTKLILQFTQKVKLAVKNIQ